MRWLFALLLAWPLIGTAQAQFLTAVGTNVVSSCPDDDGSAGDTNTDAAQYSTLLSSPPGTTYGGTITTKLGCKVAGVDYAVGLPSSQALSDPTLGGLPTGCSYASNVVTCASASSVTIQGWDFSLHNGLQLKINGNTGPYTITQNKFGVGTNCLAPINIVSSPTSVTITYDTIDGGGSSCAAFSGGTVGMIYEPGSVPNSGTRNYRYNWFKNTPEDVIDFSGPGSGSAAPDIAFNLFDRQGWLGHPDGIQECSGNFTGLTIRHNTYRNWYFSGMQQGVQPMHTEAQAPCNQSTATITNAVTKYNTLVVYQSATGTGSTCTGGSYPTNCGANYLIACKQDSPGPPTTNNTGFAAYGNYVDRRGALAALLNSSCQTTTWGSPDANWDMVSNTALGTP